MELGQDYILVAYYRGNSQDLASGESSRYLGYSILL